MLFDAWRPHQFKETTKTDKHSQKHTEDFVYFKILKGFYVICQDVLPLKSPLLANQMYLHEMTGVEHRSCETWWYLDDYDHALVIAHLSVGPNSWMGPPTHQQPRAAVTYTVSNIDTKINKEEPP